jgi:hypothetical protein
MGSSVGPLLICLYLVLALFTGGISIAVLVGNKARSTGSCCLPSSCNASAVEEYNFRFPSNNGACVVNDETAELLGCPTASANYTRGCRMSDPERCGSLEGSQYVFLAGAVGMASPFSPIIGALAGVALFITSSSSGGDFGGFVLCISALCTVGMYTATTVFAGISYNRLKNPDVPFHVIPTLRCVAENAVGNCTEWSKDSVVFLPNTTVNTTGELCALTNMTANVYGGNIAGNVRTPIAMLYFLPLVLLSLVVGVGLIVAVRAIIKHQLAKKASRRHEAFPYAVSSPSLTNHLRSAEAPPEVPMEKQDEQKLYGYSPSQKSAQDASLL